MVNPGVPIKADISKLQQDFSFVTAEKKFPDNYIKNNYLEYYVNRNISVLKLLEKLDWVNKSKLIVSGHSEGSTIAAHMAKKYKNITHLVYASGNPCGRINSIIAKERRNETDSTSKTESTFDYWTTVCKDSNNINAGNGDSHKTTYSFSTPLIDLFKASRTKTLICYGTKDVSTPFNDYWRTECIRMKKSNFDFQIYQGLDHNYFGHKPNGETDYDNYNWDKVAENWLKWLSTKN